MQSVHHRILRKYESLGPAASHLGLRKHVEELAEGRGLAIRAELGAIYATRDFGEHVLTGPIYAHWRDMGAENSWLGLPVSDELVRVGAGSTYVVFEHGYIEQAGSSAPIEHSHDYLRIYAALRHQIYSRFLALGYHGRRNFIGCDNLLANPVKPVAPVKAPLRTSLSAPLITEWQNELLQNEIAAYQQAAAQSVKDRWNTAATGGENPHLFGTWVFAMLCVEQSAGNDESAQVLSQTLSTIESLTTAMGDNELPTRWDAGIPTEDGPTHRVQFFHVDGHVPRLHVPPSDFNHFPWRHIDTLTALMGADLAQQYVDRQSDYWVPFRGWEPSMDEVTGMITSLWLVNKLVTDQDLLRRARRQAERVGMALSSSGYVITKLPGGMSYRGCSGALPVMEEPFARALSDLNAGDWHSQTDFQGAMQNAGYWRLLAGPVGEYQALTWAATIVALTGSPLMNFLALLVGDAEDYIANQLLSPATAGEALAIAAGAWQCQDVDMGPEERGYSSQTELALAALAKGAPDKVNLFRASMEAMAEIANYKQFAVFFPGYFSITGLDQPDPLVGSVFRSWFNSRTALGTDKEPEGFGAAQTCWVTAVAALLGTSPDSDTVLINRLDDAVCSMFRDCYFDPQIPLKPDGTMEKLCVDELVPTGPYGPLDFCAAVAMASLHARRQQDAGSPVSIRGFPEHFTGDMMAAWPLAGVPVDALDSALQRPMNENAIQSTLPLTAAGDTYPLFNLPAVARRMPPVAGDFPADVLTEIQVYFVDPTDKNELATGLMISPGQAIEIFGDGDIWAGDLLRGGNDAGGIEGDLIDDPSWPLHTGIDAGQALRFALLGRINGYFYIGTHFAKRKWVMPETAELYLRINDPGPGDGNGGFVVRVYLYGPKGSPVHAPYALLRDGGLILTDESRDRIFVHVEQNTVGSDEVEFVLRTPDSVTWRKEITLISGDSADPGQWTIATQDSQHEDENGLWVHQLPGGSLTFSRRSPWPQQMVQVWQINHLEEATPGSRIIFTWYQD